MNNKMVNGVVGGAVVEVDRRESESKGCDVFYPFGLAPPGVDTYVLWCVDRGRHKSLGTIEKIKCYRMKSPYKFLENRLAHPHHTARGRKCFKNMDFLKS
jgi:hypothetical protein